MKTIWPVGLFWLFVFMVCSFGTVATADSGAVSFADWSLIASDYQDQNFVTYTVSAENTGFIAGSQLFNSQAVKSKPISKSIKWFTIYYHSSRNQNSCFGKKQKKKRRLRLLAV